MRPFPLRRCGLLLLERSCRYTESATPMSVKKIVRSMKLTAATAMGCADEDWMWSHNYEGATANSHPPKTDFDRPSHPLYLYIPSRNATCRRGPFHHICSCRSQTERFYPKNLSSTIGVVQSRGDENRHQTLRTKPYCTRRTRTSPCLTSQSCGVCTRSSVFSGEPKNSHKELPLRLRPNLPSRVPRRGYLLPHFPWRCLRRWR